MYLSRLILNPRSRQVRNELADPYEMHRTVCRAFSDGNFQANEPSGILFRVDLHPLTRVPTLLVQSRKKPDWSFLQQPKDYLLEEHELPLDIENPALKEMNLQFRDGQILAFRLRANPTKRVKESTKRIGLVREQEQAAWIERKLEAAGARLISVNIRSEQFIRGKLFREKEKTKQLNFLSVQFDGVLQVKDANNLVNSIFTGFGSAKGLGFGLLSLARTR
jgi:CRISPR system Cascade subunit CasE